MRSRPSFVAATSALLAVAVLLGACGGGAEKLTAKEQTYADAFAKQLSATDGFGVDKKEGECIGEAIMRELGTAPFEKAKVTAKEVAGDKSPGELLGKGTVSDDQAKSISDAWQDCADLPELFARQGTDQYDLDATAQKCFEGKLRKSDVLDRYLQVSFTSDDSSDADAVVQDIVKLVQACSTKDGKGGILVESIASSLAADGTLTSEQATCVAQKIVDDIGADRLLDATKGGGDLSDAPTDVQTEFQAAIVKAAGGCDVALGDLSG